MLLEVTRVQGHDLTPRTVSRIPIPWEGINFTAVAFDQATGQTVGEEVTLKTDGKTNQAILDKARTAYANASQSEGTPRVGVEVPVEDIADLTQCGVSINLDPEQASNAVQRVVEL